VTNFANSFGILGMRYHCFVDPNDASYAVIDVVTVATVVHCMFWPLLSLITGLAIVLIYVFHIDSSGSSVGDDDNNHSLPSSLERRLVRVGDCTMILSGEEKLAQ
jgi:Calcium-activated potassium channel, beta subunit